MSDEQECGMQKNNKRRNLDADSKTALALQFRLFFNGLSDSDRNKIFYTVVFIARKEYQNLSNYQAENYVEKAIWDTYFGNRTWNPDTNIITYLRNTTRSIISNEEKKKEVLYSDLSNPEVATIDRWMYKANPQSHQSHKDIESRVYLTQIAEKVDHYYKNHDDPLCAKIAQIMQENPESKAEEIALVLQENLLNVQNALRRYRRTLILLKEHS